MMNLPSKAASKSMTSAATTAGMVATISHFSSDWMGWQIMFQMRRQ